MPLSPARRRRQRHYIVPPGEDERDLFLNELSRHFVTSFDFFLFTLLSGLVLGLSMLLGSFHLLILAAILAPFMAPVMGAAMGTVTGAPRFWALSLTSILTGSLIVFLCGMAGGWAEGLLQLALPNTIVTMATEFSWSGFVVLALGAALATYLIMREPQQKPLVPSVAIAYGVYAPVSAAGFGLALGNPLWLTKGLSLFAIYLVWALLISTLTFAILGLRPHHNIGYFLTLAYTVIGIAAILLVQLNQLSTIVDMLANSSTPTRIAPTQAFASGHIQSPQPSVPQSTSTPSVTMSVTQTIPAISLPFTATLTPTRTLIPTRTPTITITPQPSPVWARVAAKGTNGIVIREKPDFNAKILTSLVNDNLVEILPDAPVDQSGGVVWVHVRAPNGFDGWVIRSLLSTSTPTPAQ